MIKILIALFISFNSYAEFNFSTKWVDYNTKVLKLTCSGEDTYRCDYICQDEFSCEIEEGICRNCVGNDLFITNFFKNVGHLIQSKDYELAQHQVYKPFMFDDFVTLTSDSIYNIITDYDSKKMKKQFMKLCPKGTKNSPVVFLSVDEFRIPVSISFVSCDSQFYEITDKPQIYSREILD